jgi:rhodanese-related sulfurtransferase
MDRDVKAVIAYLFITSVVLASTLSCTAPASTTPSGLAANPVTPMSKASSTRVTAIMSQITVQPPAPTSVAFISGIAVITAEELNQKMSHRDTDFVVVDARSQSDFYDGHLPDSINIEPDVTGSAGGQAGLALKLKLLPRTARDGWLIFYDTGADSSDAVSLAKLAISINYGYEAINVTILSGGFHRWAEMGYPIMTQST